MTPMAQWRGTGISHITFVGFTYVYIRYMTLKHDLTLREERRLRVFENWILKRMFGPKKNEKLVWKKNFAMRKFIVCTVHLIYWE